MRWKVWDTLVYLVAKWWDPDLQVRNQRIYMRRLTLRLLNIYIIFYFFLKVGKFSSFSPPHFLFLDFTKVALHVSQFKISPDYLILSLSIISCLTLDTVAPLSLRPPAESFLLTGCPLVGSNSRSAEPLWSHIQSSVSKMASDLHVQEYEERKKTAPETVWSSIFTY